MAYVIADIRTELQLPSQVLDDTTISSVLTKVGDTDLNLICAECLRLVLNKYRGRVWYRIGNYSERIDTKEIRNQIRIYMARSSATETEYTPDANEDTLFTQDGI